MSSTKCPERLGDVVAIVAKRLAMLGRHDAAGELYEQIDKVPAAPVFRTFQGPFHEYRGCLSRVSVVVRMYLEPLCLVCISSVF